MKHKSNRNKQAGFTMVELLASIVIMGLLVAVAIGAISFVLDIAKKRYYESLEKTVTLAGQNYYADHKNLLPKAIGDSRKITLKTLVQNKYLENVLDYGKKDCTASDGSYIKVYKYTKDKYSYSLYLNCPSYKITEKAYENNLKVSFKYDYNTKNIQASYYTATMTASGGSKVASYNYTIYQNNKVVYTSENIAAGAVTSISKKINLKKYVPGNIKISVLVYDTYGNHKLFMSDEKSIYDETVPTCGKVSPSYTTWLSSKNPSRKVSITCINGEGSCLQKQFSKTFTADADVDYITIKGKNADGSGRGERKCPVNVKIDTKEPSCGTNDGSTRWTKDTRTVSILCSDETSGCKKSNYSKEFNKTTKQSTIEIEDIAGNTTSCPVNVYVDKTPPTCGTVSGASTSWTNGDRTISVGCQDSDSGCEQATFTNTFTSDATTGNITIKDRAGNTANCPVNVYIDKTRPVIKILGFGKLNYAENRNCTGKTTANGNFECNIRVTNPSYFGYSTTREYTDNLSGINWNRDEYYFYSRTYSGAVASGSTNCPYWFDPNGPCGAGWKICRSNCDQFSHAYQKERIFDNAGNVSHELSIYFTRW